MNINELLSNRCALTTGFLFNPTFLVFCIVTVAWEITHRLSVAAGTEIIMTISLVKMHLTVTN